MIIDEKTEEKENIDKILSQVSLKVNLTRLTYFVKLILCAKNHGKYIDVVKKKIIEDPKIVNRQYGGGHTTPLMVACGSIDACPNIEIAKILLDVPIIDINKHDKKGRTALMFACKYRNTELVELLLDQPDIDVNKHNKEGWTVLMHACSHGKIDVNMHNSSIDIIKLLLNKSNINVNKQTSDRWTALMVACRYSNDAEKVKLLLDVPCIDINKSNDDGWSALMIACRYSNTETVSLLLSRPNIDINKFNNDGWSALMIAFKLNIKMAKLLLGHPNIDLNGHCEELGITPLMEACSSGNTKSNIEIVKLLLSRSDISINKKNSQGNTAFTIACINLDVKSNVEIVKLLLENINFDISKLTVHELKEVLYNLGLHDKMFQKTVVEKYVESVVNKGVDLQKNILEMLIDNNVMCSELLLSRILCPLKNDLSCMLLMLKNHRDKKKILHYCNLHLNIKTDIHKNISNHKENIYCRPNNIVALCSEVNFKLKYKCKTQIFMELNEKLKFLFDIKNEEDLINKIMYHLCGSE